MSISAMTFGELEEEEEGEEVTKVFVDENQATEAFAELRQMRNAGEMIDCQIKVS